MCLSSTIKTVPQNSLAAGVLSVAILFGLTGLGAFSAKTLNSPEHNESCAGEGPALWAISNFYFSILGGGIGALYELYLVLIGKIFEVETVPVIPRIRGFNAGYIFTVGLIFDAFMVLGSSNADLLNKVVFAIVLSGPVFAPGLAFSGTQQTIGNIYFGVTTLISMAIIFFTGTAYGGDSTRLLLSGSKLLSAVGAIFTPPNVNLRNNIQFHILRLIANIMVIAAYLTAHAESSCFPQEAETLISDKLFLTLGVSVAAGWALNIALAYNKDTATFPWGGSVTHQQLAAKFGWPSVIISIILLPFLMLWSKLLAFPVWMPFKSGPFYLIKNTLVYPGNEDVMRQKVYTGPTSTARFPAGWNCHADVKGKKFFEAFWGIIQVLDLDANDDRMIVSPNFMTWLLVDKVYLEYPKAPVFENKARFYFPLKGPNMLNPFCWVTLIFGISGLTWFGQWSFVPFKEEEGVTTISKMFPPGEDSKNLYPDGSLIYEKGDKKSD